MNTQTAQLIIKYLQRSDLKGFEVEEMAHCKGILHAIIKQNESDEIEKIIKQREVKE